MERKDVFAMKLMKEACKENPDWLKCCECPFTEKCDLIVVNPGHVSDTPSEWEVEK